MSTSAARWEARPATRRYLQLAGQLESLFRGTPAAPGAINVDRAVLKTQEQKVRFRMEGGRVQHDVFELSDGGVVIRTGGSVGLDETLDLVVEIPVQRQWLGREPVRLGWQNQVIRVPIRGTLSRPKIDERALGQLAAQLARQTGQRLLEDQLQKQLEKILPPGGQPRK